MRRSLGCLRIIACGSGSIIEANEDGPVDQIKRPKEKRGWSFKKKNSSSRAVTNSLITETPSFEHKENAQSAVSESFVSENDYALHWDEKGLEPPQVAVDLSVPHPVIVYKTEKQPATAAASSYVADDVSSPQTDKKLAKADAISYVADDLPSSENEKHSEATNLFVTDGLTGSKIGECETVLSVHESDVQKELESIVKLQAIIRGHLVRCHAVGALRCVQAIVKMQVLVRARYACSRKDHIPPKRKSEITYTSMTDLLKNSFARQLLESSPKSKPVNIKCDPLSRDSSWVWLERWMSLASPGAKNDIYAGKDMMQEVIYIGKECEETAIDEEQEEKITVEDYLFNEENEIFLDVKDKNLSLSREHSKLGIAAELNVANSDELSSNNSNVDLHSASLDESQNLDILDEVKTVGLASEKSSLNHTATEGMQPQIDSVDESFESKTEQALNLETEVTELGNEVCEELKTEVEDQEIVQLQTETKNIVSVSREEPVHLLVTEFEHVSTTVSADISYSVLQDAGVKEPISDTHLAVMYHDSIPLKWETEEGPASVRNSTMDYIHASHNGKTEEVDVPHSSKFYLNDETAASSEDDIVINHNEAIQVVHWSIEDGELDYSTELSITSTLDSPDRLEIELEKVVPGDVEIHESKSNAAGDELETDSGTVEKRKSDFACGGSAVSATADDMGVDEKENKINVSTLEFQSETCEEKDTKTDGSDLHAEPEGDTEISYQSSPGSQVTLSKSQGTPSGQVSVSRKSKISKSRKSGSIKKRTILSAAKKSPMSVSSEKNRSEKQPNDQKSAKRRTSFSSPKPEVSDQEQRRDSSTSSSLPSYMQATESARAKANAAGQSPRSSPDVPENDIFLQKRHSLSRAKDKQDSPRLRQTSSQAHSDSKSNGTSPLERKWKR